ncbi:MAG: hypothetical protein JWL64_2108 [Frankiales bacterium]|nr:hypothetical protein [Frankiales bacterium]
MTLTSDGPAAAGNDERWAPGEIFGLHVPADVEALLSDGTTFLTEAFRASGALSADNSVSRIVQWQEFDGGGTGKKLLLTVAYDTPGPGLPEELFVKFSRNFDNALWDSGRHQMISEVAFAVLSRSPDFPVPVPAMMFADVDPETHTGLLVTECIPYGRDGVENLHPKCMDYDVPDQVGHYKAILRGLARLSGAHRAGRLSPEFDADFPYDPDGASPGFGGEVPEIKIVQRATRLFEFVDRYPRLFPDNVRTAEFREQFLRDIPDVVAAGERIREVLHGNPDFIAFAHWNANIDNCWFRPGADGLLEAGFLDWANASQLSVAQSINGAISGAERFVWDEHLDELLTVFIEEYAASGGPLLGLDELRLHILLLTASGMAHSMGAPIALPREIEDIGALESYRDSRLVERENARIQLHMTTRLLNLWQTRKLGDVVRAL